MPWYDRIAVNACPQSGVGLYLLLWSCMFWLSVWIKRIKLNICQENFHGNWEILTGNELSKTVLKIICNIWFWNTIAFSSMYWAYPLYYCKEIVSWMSWSLCASWTFFLWTSAISNTSDSSPVNNEWMPQYRLLSGDKLCTLWSRYCGQFVLPTLY